MRELAARTALSTGCLDEDRSFYAEMNARLVVDAERHHRAVYRAGQESWNLRDRHMTHTLEQLVAHAHRREGAAKAVVWEHNSHVGDARATDMSELGQLNVGQLYRPETELMSHYFNATVGDQFDAVIHIDETHAVEPLERTSGWERGELPDTYPWSV